LRASALTRRKDARRQGLGAFASVLLLVMAGCAAPRSRAISDPPAAPPAGRDAPLSLSAPGAPPRVPADESELQPRGITYARGALVLHALRGELGDAAFWSSVRLYVRTRAGQGARSADLRAAFEAAGHRALVPFFAKWVYAPAPDL
jgi:hypothetical protein